jgi:hypothetical protein
MNVLPIKRNVLTPLGPATATEMIVWDADDFIWYSCWMDETGENWFFDNREVRLNENITAGRVRTSAFYMPQPRLGALRSHILRHKLSPFYKDVQDSTGVGCAA